jgi:hypothetical protein
LHESYSEIVHIDIHVVPPCAAHPYWFLFTTGMSAVSMNIPTDMGLVSSAELCLSLPPAWPLDSEHLRRESRWSWPVRELQSLARFPHRHDTWLGEGHTIADGDPPGPYDPSTKLAATMLAPSWVTDEGTIDETTELLALWPLHAEELTFKLEHGALALFELLESAGVTEVLDPHRPSVVSASTKRTTEATHKSLFVTHRTPPN